jgi:hypothetical protein
MTPSLEVEARLRRVEKSRSGRETTEAGTLRSVRQRVGDKGIGHS